MQLVYKISDKATVTLQNDNQKDLFEDLSDIQEVFGNDKCGKCQNTNLKYQVREVDGNKFYEVFCTSCFARLSYGSHKKGNTLFPKRKDENGKYLNTGGWLKWNKEKNVME